MYTRGDTPYPLYTDQGNIYIFPKDVLFTKSQVEELESLHCHHIGNGTFFLAYGVR